MPRRPVAITPADVARAIPRAKQIEQLPLFANDREIGAALLGFERACEWRALAPLYERKGFPKIDPIMGGRYVPAIKAFFDYQYGLGSIIPTTSDGTDRPDTWKTPVGQKRRD